MISHMTETANMYKYGRFQRTYMWNDAILYKSLVDKGLTFQVCLDDNPTRLMKLIFLYIFSALAIGFKNERL